MPYVVNKEVVSCAAAPGESWHRTEGHLLLKHADVSLAQTADPSPLASTPHTPTPYAPLPLASLS